MEAHGAAAEEEVEAHGAAAEEEVEAHGAAAEEEVEAGNGAAGCITVAGRSLCTVSAGAGQVAIESLPLVFDRLASCFSEISWWPSLESLPLQLLLHSRPIVVAIVTSPAVCLTATHFLSRVIPSELQE